MFTAILWDYDGTLANTPVKNIAVTRAVLGRLDPALLDPLPDALSSLAAYQAANYRWRNWRELYRHALGVPADRLDEAGALWGPCQLADRTLPPLFDGLSEVLPRLEALLARYHLPTATDYAAADLYEKTLSDKKRAGDTLSLVVPTAWGKSVLHPIPVGQLLTWIERGLGQ